MRWPGRPSRVAIRRRRLGALPVPRGGPPDPPIARHAWTARTAWRCCEHNAQRQLKHWYGAEYDFGPSLSINSRADRSTGDRREQHARRSTTSAPPTGTAIPRYQIPASSRFVRTGASQGHFAAGGTDGRSGQRLCKRAASIAARRFNGALDAWIAPMRSTASASRRHLVDRPGSCATAARAARRLAQREIGVWIFRRSPLSRNGARIPPGSPLRRPLDRRSRHAPRRRPCPSSSALTATAKPGSGQGHHQPFQDKLASPCACSWWRGARQPQF